ncbi:MAG: hypothetical protein ACI8RZ_003694 [Myxococcota bacterium]|jgi:hypothetical protein
MLNPENPMLLSTLALFASLMTSTASAESLGRDLTGRSVVIEVSPVKTAVVFWSLDCTECISEMVKLESAGIDMVAINTDSAAVASRLRAAVRTHGISSPIISDASGRLQRQFQLVEGVVVINELGVLESRSTEIHTAAALAPSPNGVVWMD